MTLENKADKLQYLFLKVKSAVKQQIIRDFKVNTIFAAAEKASDIILNSE
jgi:hypothetical protein